MQMFITMTFVTDKTSAAVLNQQEVTEYFKASILFTKPSQPYFTGLSARRLTRCCSLVSAAACWARCRPPPPPGRPPPAGAAGPPTSGPTIRC